MDYFWAKIELLGHRVRYGRCSVVEFLGAQMLRVEMPFAEPKIKTTHEPKYTESQFTNVSLGRLVAMCKEEFGECEDHPVPWELVKRLCNIRHDVSREEYASIEEYAASALYGRTLMTEEQVRQALKPHQVASPYRMLPAVSDDWHGQDDDEPFEESKREPYMLVEQAQNKPQEPWSYEFADVDGDILILKSSGAASPDGCVIDVGIRSRRSGEFYWCPNTKQLEALWNRIGHILNAESLKEPTVAEVEAALDTDRKYPESWLCAQSADALRDAYEREYGHRGDDLHLRAIMDGLALLTKDEQPFEEGMAPDRHEIVSTGETDAPNNKPIPTHLPHWRDIDEHSYVAMHIDLDDCPHCSDAKLHPQISQDGSAFEAERCEKCNRKWWFDMPRQPLPEMIRPKRQQPSEAP